MNKNKTIWSALLVMFLWGLLFPLVKLGFSACGVETTADIMLFAGLRFVICGGIITAYAALTDRSSFRGIERKSKERILLAGLISIVLHYTFNYMGLELTDSSKTALLKQMGPLLYICFSFLFVKEDKPTVRKLIAGGMGFLGIIALNYSAGGFSFGVGDVLILCASVCVVSSSVISKRLYQAMAPVTATGLSQLFGGLVLTGLGLITGGSLTLSGTDPVWILSCICAASTVSYCIWSKVIKRGELSGLFIIKFSEPIFACVFGAILLGENIWRLQYLAAFLLTSGGIWISNQRKKNQT